MLLQYLPLTASITATVKAATTIWHTTLNLTTSTMTTVALLVNIVSLQLFITPIFQRQYFSKRSHRQFLLRWVWSSVYIIRHYNITFFCFLLITLTIRTECWTLTSNTLISVLHFFLKNVLQPSQVLTLHKCPYFECPRAAARPRKQTDSICRISLTAMTR